MITVSASLDRVTARCADRVVADHQRLWGTAGLASDPEHLARRRPCARTSGTDHLPVLTSTSRSKSLIWAPMTPCLGPVRSPDGPQTRPCSR